MSDQASEIQEITFSVLGDSFTLRCRKSQEQELKSAVLSVQELAAKILRDSPTLSPQQAAILAAIESQSRLQRYMGGSTPFQDQAWRLTREIKGILSAATDNSSGQH